jgi:hypothetical protein
VLCDKLLFKEIMRIMFIIYSLLYSSILTYKRVWNGYTYIHEGNSFKESESEFLNPGTVTFCVG